MFPDVPTSEMQTGAIEFEGDGSAPAGVGAATSANARSTTLFGAEQRMGPPRAKGGRVACCRALLRAAAAEIILRPVGRRNGKWRPRVAGTARSTPTPRSPPAAPPAPRACRAP